MNLKLTAIWNSNVRTHTEKRKEEEATETRKTGGSLQTQAS